MQVNSDVPKTSLFLAIRKVFSFLANDEKWVLAKLMSFSFCLSLFEIITAISIVVLANILNKPESGQHYLALLGITKHFSSSGIILIFALGVGFLYLIKNLFTTYEIYYQHFSIQTMNYHFKRKILDRFANIDFRNYLTKNTAQGIAIVSSDAELIFSIGMVSLATIFSESIVFFALISLIIYLNPEIAIFIFTIGSILGLLLIKGLSNLFYRWGQKVQEMTILENKNLFHFFHGFKEIILLGKKDPFVNAFYKCSRQRSEVMAISNITNVLPRILTELLFVGLFIICIAYFCLTNHTSQQMIGLLGGYLYIGFRLMPGFNRIVTQLNTFKSIIPSIEKIHHEYHLHTQKAQSLEVPNFRFNQVISLNNVNFQYLNTKKMALQNINLEIKKGEWLGIIGETGSGKSTLSDLLLGLLIPQQGKALIDYQYPLNCVQWYALIGYVPQTVYLIDDTICANIAFGESSEHINEQKMQRAIMGAQLQDFIQTLPQGLDTPVGERGLQLSGGERQRIAIARALYRDPEVLIFDEGTSALDNATESQLMQTIENIHQDHTIIMIAHRLSTLKNCDRIVIMKQGKIDRIIQSNALDAATYQT